MLDLAFEQPRWFWLMALLVPVAFIGLRWFVPMTRVRRWSAVVARLLLTGLLLAILAGASSTRTSDRLAVVGVLDISGSVRRFASGGVDAQGKAIDAIAASKAFFDSAFKVGGGRGADDLAGLVVFDGRSLAIAAPTRADVAERTIDVAGVEGSNLSQALRTAAAMIPGDVAGRLVLVSDGNQTSGDALATAREISKRGGAAAGGKGGLAIDAIPLTYRVTRETIVERVDAPPRGAAESAITLRVALWSTEGGKGTLRVLREGQTLDINGAEPGTGRTLALGAGRHIELVRVELPPGRIHRFEAVYEPDREDGGVEGAVANAASGVNGADLSAPRLVGDTRLENNRAEAFTLTPGRGSVLLVDGVGQGSRSGPGATLARVLEEAQIDVTLVASSAFPADVLDLQAFDLVILQNVPAEALEETQQRNLVAHVKDVGGGLVMIGGPDSLGPGGWKGTAVEPILPVRLDLPERLVQPDAAVALVLDNSGSMRFSVMNSLSSQQEIANQAAALAIRTLDKKDLVSIVTFNSEPTLLQPLSPNTDPKALGERILAISPDGGTNLGPALEMARDQLAPAKASLKHIIVLTDGRSMNADRLPAQAQRIREKDGILITTIAIGDASNEKTLAEMAAAAGGAYYPVTNPQTLPRLFVKAIRVVRTPMIREAVFKPVVTGSGSALTADLPMPVPTLGGLVLTQARPEALITNAMVSDQGEPLLSHWNVELGQVAVFTSDAHQWAREWLDWPGYRKLWTQIVRVIGKPAAASKFELSTEVEDDRLRVRLDAIGEDGKAVDLLRVPTTVYVPGGENVELMLTQTGPGMYEGEVPAGASGHYIAVARPALGGVANGGGAGGQRLSPVTAGTSVASGSEYRELSDNAALLVKIAEETGGRVLDLAKPGEAGLFRRDGLEATVARTPLWRPLLMLAIVVMLLDVGTRRVAWDRLLESREVRPRTIRESAGAAWARLRERGVVVGAVGAEGASTGSSNGSSTGAEGEAGTGRGAARGRGSMALSEADAAALVDASRAERRKRILEEAAARERAAQELGATGGMGAGDAMGEGGGKAEAEGGESGLLAAKRRARKRMEGE